MKNRAVIKKTGFDDYRYNVQQWTKVDGEWCYCGVGKFCKTLKEARQEKQRIERSDASGLLQLKID